MNAGGGEVASPLVDPVPLVSGSASRVPKVLARVLLSLTVALAGCSEGGAPRTQVAKAGPGEILFLTHCQSCHGANGRGDGLAAASLKVAPADLTALWKSYGTPLDRERLARYIDGTQLSKTHGREMPLWGDQFFGETPVDTGSEEIVKRRLIDVLVVYLETIQLEPST